MILPGGRTRRLDSFCDPRNLRGSIVSPPQVQSASEPGLRFVRASRVCSRSQRWLASAFMPSKLSHATSIKSVAVSFDVSVSLDPRHSDVVRRSRSSVVGLALWVSNPRVKLTNPQTRWVQERPPTFSSPCVTLCSRCLRRTSTLLHIPADSNTSVASHRPGTVRLSHSFERLFSCPSSPTKTEEKLSWRVHEISYFLYSKNRAEYLSRRC